MNGQDEVEGFGINRRTEKRITKKSVSQKKQSTSMSCRRKADFASIIITLAGSYSQVTIVSTMLRIFDQLLMICAKIGVERWAMCLMYYL